MNDKAYKDAIGKAARALSSHYYMVGQDLDAYLPVKRGMCMGLAIVFDYAPQTVEYEIDEFVDHCLM